MKPVACSLILLLAACGVRTRTHADSEYPPRPETCPIAVFLDDAPMDVGMRNAFLEQHLASADKPPGHQVIGTVDAYISFEVGWADAVKKASREARRIGGDALLLVDGRRPQFDQEAYCLFRILRYGP